jgi:hypothetical protein
MKRIIIVGLACGLIGIGIGYFQKVRETEQYIHVIQVNGTIIEGNFQSIGIEDLKELNDLFFKTKGANHKILQILVTNSNEAELVTGGFDDNKPYPYQTSELTYLAKKIDGHWEITAEGRLSTIIN